MRFRYYFLLFYITILPISYATETINIFGISLISWINIFLFGLSIFDGLFDNKDGVFGKTNLFSFILLASFIISVTYSVISGFPVIKSVVNASAYYLPFTILSTIKKSKIGLINIIKPIIIGLTLAALVSIGIFLGLIDSRVNTGVLTTDSIAFNYNYVDGAAGVFGAVFAVWLLSDRSIVTRKSLGIVCAIDSLIIVLFYQSRGRIVLALIMVVMMLFLNALLTGLKNQVKGIIAFVLIGVLFVCILNRNASLVFNYERIINRVIGTNGEDKNLVYRLNEINEYWNMFLKNPIFGRGWGLLNNEKHLNFAGSQFRAHNMYITVIGVTGFSYGLIFLGKILSLLISGFKKMIKTRSTLSVFSFCTLLSIAILGITNAGFGKLYGVMFMIAFYCTIQNQNNLMQ